jgi:hypothetical protein
MLKRSSNGFENNGKPITRCAELLPIMFPLIWIDYLPKNAVSLTT